MKRSARARSSRRDADAQRIVGVLLGEARVGLAAAAQRQAGGDARHPEPRREGLGQKLGQALQADLGQRVGEEIRIEVVELLVEQVHDQAGLAVGQLPRQGLRQQQGRAQVDGHVAVEIVGLGSGRAVELEQRGAVDQAGQLHAPRTALADQRLGLSRRGEVGAHRLGLAARGGDIRHGLAGLGGRAVMVDEHEIAVGRQRHRQCAADPHGRSGDQRAVHALGARHSSGAIFFGIGR